MELAAAGLFRAKWTEQIHEEWIRNVLKNREDLTREQLNRTKELMNASVPDCLVDGYSDIVPALSLPDADDRHVLAAAIVSSSDAIVTFNLSDFPKKTVSSYDIEVLHPDDFIFHQFGLNNAGVIIAAQRCRARLTNPPRTAAEYLETLERQGLPKTVAMASACPYAEEFALPAPEYPPRLNEPFRNQNRRHRKPRTAAHRGEGGVRLQSRSAKQAYRRGQYAQPAPQAVREAG